MAEYSATDDFAAALKEVDVLLALAKEREADIEYLNTMNKASILLLTAKFESFVEQIIEEFCFRVSSLNLRCEHLPMAIRIAASRHHLAEDVLSGIERGGSKKVIPALQAVGALWVDGCVPSSLKIDCAFSYGKHGEKEIKRLFQRIGLDDVFEECKVLDASELFDDATGQHRASVAPTVNAITGYRNYIIHNDGTPSLTFTQIAHYRDSLLAFSQCVDASLVQKNRDLQIPIGTSPESRDEMTGEQIS